MKLFKSISAALFTFISLSVAGQDGAGYGRTILSVSPVQMSERTPTGIGIQYERFMGTSGKFSLYVPLAYSYGKSDACDASVRSRVFYAYPGIKFYPAGSKHIVSYAVGPSLAFGRGCTNYDSGDPTMSTEQLKSKGFEPVTEMGIMLNNSLNAQATEHVYIGGEFGIGTTYLNTQNGRNIGNDLMLNINVRLGYRF